MPKVKLEKDVKNDIVKNKLAEDMKWRKEEILSRIYPGQFARPGYNLG